jgi:hypothetical protein
MSNVENQMTKEARMSKPETIGVIRHSGFVIPSTFGFRHSSFGHSRG